MTINVETDHPHGVAHVALFTCQHRPAGQSPSSISVQQDLGRTHSGAAPALHTRHLDIPASLRRFHRGLWPATCTSTSTASHSRRTALYGGWAHWRCSVTDQPPSVPRPHTAAGSYRAPAELMVVRLDPKSSQFLRGDDLLTWHPAPSRRSSAAAELDPRTLPEYEGAWPRRNEVGKRPVT